jgi:hypothetical protein
MGTGTPENAYLILVQKARRNRYRKKDSFKPASNVPLFRYRIQPKKTRGVFGQGAKPCFLQLGQPPADSGSQLLLKEVIVLITAEENRMLELLWFVGYCGDFPSQLAYRIGGHPEWNRHVMYRAIKLGYVTVYRGQYRQRVIRSLRLTESGMDYIGERDPASLSVILAKLDAAPTGSHSSIERIVRTHSLATGLVMAHSAGAHFLPAEKPSLLSRQLGADMSVPPEAGQAYFYSPAEIRSAIQELDDSTVPKGSRMIGVIAKDRYLYLMYHTGSARMVWFPATEDNTAAVIETILHARGLNCEVRSQIIIGSNMSVAEKITHSNKTGRNDRYFSVSNAYNNCYFLTNNQEGDELLETILDQQKQQRLNTKTLSHYRPPASNTRQYDAVTRDGTQPITLNYKCDLLTLLNFDYTPNGFSGCPIMLCLDYQQDVVQRILGPLAEVRVCK